MRIDDIIALALITGAGGIGYLLYTKQLDWFDSDSPKTKDEGEEEKIIKDIKEPESKNIIPKNKDFKIPEFLEDFFDKPSSSGSGGNNVLSGAQEFVSDWVDRGRKAIDNLVKPFTKPTTTTTTIIPKNKDFKKPTLDRYFFDKSGETSLDDLITDAFRGNPFKPYPGTAGRPSYS